MRYNTALGCTEIRKAGSDEPFVPADERMRNTIAIKARLDGINAWDKDIRRYTESDFVKVFNYCCPIKVQSIVFSCVTPCK